jgi:hypothetical protein
MDNPYNTPDARSTVTPVRKRRLRTVVVVVVVAVVVLAALVWWLKAVDAPEAPKVGIGPPAWSR